MGHQEELVLRAGMLISYAYAQDMKNFKMTLKATMIAGAELMHAFFVHHQKTDRQ